MAVEVRATASAFDGLVNPYTGAKTTTMMVVTGAGEPMFHADRDEYSPWNVYPTAEDAMREWSRENGVYGLRHPPFLCAYTGAVMTLEKVDGGYRFAGGFNPKLFRSRESYLYYATMRGGKTDLPVPATNFPRRVDEVVRPDAPARRKQSRAADLTQEGIDTAKGVVEANRGLFEPGSTVSMSVVRKKPMNSGRAGKAKSGGRADV